MNNLEILKVIDKKIQICKEKINAKSAKGIKAIISDIEKLTKQYKPENDIQQRIIKNRISEVNNLKNASQSTKEKNREIRL